LKFLNIVIHEHQFKRKGKFHFDEEAYMKIKRPDYYVLHWKSSYDVMFVYVPKSSTTSRGFLICMIVRHRDMQEYNLMFSIALEW
jgi:hypothetical protein